MATSAVYIPEIIKLQLRKPKHWNWELSTSKSSPNITMPIIKLYDYKGNLLVEAKDNGTTTTNVYGSDLKLNENNFHPKYTKSRKSISRSRSDTFGPPSSFINKATSAVPINSQDRKRFIQRSNNSTNGKDSKECTRKNDRKTLNAVENPAFQENEHNQKMDYETGMEKSSSDLLHEKIDNSNDNLLLSSNVERSRTLQNGEKKRHKRSKSDDLFRRKLRYNSEESIKRAEMDGYRNFITPNIPKDETQSNQEIKSNKNKKSNRNRQICAAEILSVDGNSRNIELSELVHNRRYTTRTSSAGTLIIPEENLKEFENGRRRRRRRRANSCSFPSLLEPVVESKDANEVPLSSNVQSLSSTIKKDSGILQEAPTIALLEIEDEKYISKTGRTRISPRERYSTLDRLLLQTKNEERKSTTGSSQSRTDVVLLNKKLNDENNNYYSFDCNNCVVNGERDAVSKSTSKIENRENRKNKVRGSSIGESQKRPDGRSGIRRKTINVQDSSSSSERSIKTEKGHLIREHSAQRQKGEGASSSNAACDSGDADDLLKLVRRLSHSFTPPRKPPIDGEDAHQEVKMGANVSRHSAKGLGRRSQSSGSICNGGGGSGSIGKGSGNRHPEGKICSSLPSYLDDRDKNTCNNNHDGKHHLDGAERIPPLGDSAPLHWKFSETQTICDQGYGSERSPEEEYPPILTSLDQDSLQCHHHLEPHACYPFITPESTFVVKLTKGSRGLGLSVTGGIDSTGSWPGLIRIKRLFPHQPASACGLLNVGDLLLEANGITLTGLTNYEALEVLRTAPNQVDLKICRPPPDVLNCVSPISEVPPPPPRREPPNSLNLPSNAYTTPEDEYYHGEFEITLKKIQGSLGFTLRKEDDSALGHYVRALVREPALTDGRIRAGDKIIAVNDVEICPMSHENAVQFLRQCPDIVKLRLYRDSAQTPVATLSPTETTPRTSFSRKAHLRQEAVDMLNDLAGRKLCMNTDSYNRSSSPNSSPRRLRRNQCPSDASQCDFVSHNDYVTQHGDYVTFHPQVEQMGDYEIYHEQFHEGIIQKCPMPFDEDAFNSLFLMESDDADKPNRPSSLELYNPNQTPVACRKPRFNFSLAHNAYELNNLDAEVLDAPNIKYNLCNEDVKSSGSEVQEPVSMPHIPSTTSNFSYKHPAYQSAHPQINPEPTTIEQAPSPPPPSKHGNKVDSSTIRRRKSVAAPETDAKSNLASQKIPMKEEYEVLAIELNRGWNSRLGFSLQGAAGVTYVSAVHADSVAARDGRLKPGDRLIKVNDESIEHMTTSEVIDLLRIVRGPVCIVISRIKSNEDCPKSNAEN